MRTTFWTSLPALAMGAPRAVQTTPVAAERAAPLSAGRHRGPTNENDMTEPQFGFSVSQANGDQLELDVYSVIGDVWEEAPITAKAVRQQLRGSKASSIRVRINSLGGDVLDALSIYNQLREHPARVEVDVCGIAASAATIVAMAGDVIRMADSAELMIHEPRFPVMVNVDSEKAKKAAERLDKEVGILAGIYARRTERSEEEIRDLMRAETWFTAAEARAAGLVDEITGGGAGEEPSVEASVAALQRFRNVPERLVARARQARPPLPPPPPVTPTVNETAGKQATAAEPATPQEQHMDLKSLARDLGLSEDATESQIRSTLTESRTAAAGMSSLLGVLGVSTVDAARGAIEAGRVASAELPKAQARVAELEKDAEDRERAAVIARLESERRITPAQRDGFCKAASIETLRAFAESAPVILAASQHREAPVSGATGPAAPVTHAGKAYEELTGPERISLRETDKEAFDGLRNDWLSRGQPISKSAG
jgi:ATP-dependent protease ClpP protease subunit